MKILVMNCGSSSLKYQLIDMENESVLAKGLCERIGIDGYLLTHTPAGGEKYKVEAAMPSHKEAVKKSLRLEGQCILAYLKKPRNFSNSYFLEVYLM